MHRVEWGYVITNFGNYENLTLLHPYVLTLKKVELPLMTRVQTPLGTRLPALSCVRTESIVSHPSSKSSSLYVRSSIQRARSHTFTGSRVSPLPVFLCLADL